VLQYLARPTPMEAMFLEVVPAMRAIPAQSQQPRLLHSTAAHARQCPALRAPTAAQFQEVVPAMLVTQGR